MAEVVLTPEERAGYEKWVQNGRIRTSTCDILGFVGLFIFGWLLWYVYGRAGKSGWYIFVPIIACYVLSQYIPILALVGIGIYVIAWAHIHGVIKKYNNAYNAEARAAPVAAATV